jgi:hypothetical protein
MYVLKTMQFGIGETNVRAVTEKVHQFNEGVRTWHAWRMKKRKENAGNEAKRRRMRGSRMRYRRKP